MRPHCHLPPQVLYHPLRQCYSVNVVLGYESGRPVVFNHEIDDSMPGHVLVNDLLEHDRQVLLAVTIEDRDFQPKGEDE